MDLLEVQALSKTYGSGETAVHALKNVSFSVPKGEFRLSALVSIPQDIDYPTIASKSLSKIAPLKDLRLKR